MWGPQGTHIRHTFQYPRSRMMWLTFPLRMNRLSASCRVVLRPSSGTMVSSRCNISGLTVVTGRSERGKSGSSTFPVSEAVSPFTQRPTAFTLTVELPQTLQRLIISRQQGILSQHVVCTANCWMTPFWGATAVVLSVRNLYNFIHQCRKLKTCFIWSLTILLVIGQEKLGITFWATYLF